MSRNASITMTWGDGEYPFRLAIGQLRALQEKTDSGPLELLTRMMEGRWRVDDAAEILRQGLIGGGRTPVEAAGLIRTYVHERPLAESLPFAQVVLAAALYGAPDEPLKKEPAPTGAAEAETASVSPISTAPGP